MALSEMKNKPPTRHQPPVEVCLTGHVVGVLALDLVPGHILLGLHQDDEDGDVDVGLKLYSSPIAVFN